MEKGFKHAACYQSKRYKGILLKVGKHLVHLSQYTLYYMYNSSFIYKT